MARNLKAEIDPELIEQYRKTVSLPFEPGDYKRIAVKVIDDRGIESLKVVGGGDGYTSCEATKLKCNGNSKRNRKEAASC